MSINEAIQNALDYIEAKNGHKDGDIYRDLAAAKYEAGLSGNLEIGTSSYIRVWKDGQGR